MATPIDNLLIDTYMQQTFKEIKSYETKKALYRLANIALEEERNSEELASQIDIEEL